MSAVTILAPEFLLPRPDPAALMAGAGVAVSDDRVAAIDEVSVLKERWPEAGFEPLPDALVMPGLVNAHQHGRGISQIQLGYPDDYLELWIANRRARGVLDAYPITKLAAAAMLENGVTTTVHANYTYGSGDYEAEVRASLLAYDEAGIRVTMCVGAMDRGFVVYPPHEDAFMAALPEALRRWLEPARATPYAGDGAATVALMERLLADYAGHPRIRFCYGPAGLQWVSDALLAHLADDAANKGLGLHLHLLESPAQRAAARELYPDGALLHMARLGALNAETVLAHGVFVDDGDIEVIAEHQAIIVRNPSSNLRVRDGIAPLAGLLRHGVRVAIGTDNTALTEDEDLLRELKLADLLARQPDWHGPSPPSTRDLLEMLTVNGAAAAGVATEVGTLAVGARADLVAIKLDGVRQPYLDPDMGLVDALLARASGRDVSLTMVDGRILYRDGCLMGIDKRAVEQQAVAAARSARGPREPEDVARTERLKDYLAAHYRDLIGGR